MPEPLITNAQTELVHFLKLFDEVLAGKKPLIQIPHLLRTGTNPDIPNQRHSVEQRIVRLFEHMYDNHCLTEQPGTYLHIAIGPDQQSYGLEKSTGGNPICPVRNTHSHPVSSELVDEAAMLRHHLRDIGYHAIAILGEYDAPPLHYSSTHAIILPAFGDIRSARALARLLRDKASGNSKACRIPLIIMGRGAIGFWKPVFASLSDLLIDKLNIDTGDKNTSKSGTFDALAPLNIHAIKDIDDLADQLKTLRVKKGEALPPTDPLIQPGSTLLVATKTRDKIYELRKQFDGTNIKLIPLDVIANFKNPKETSGTYAANAKEKIDEGIRALSDVVKKQGFAPFRDSLIARGINPDHLYLLAEDSGLHLDNEGILEHMDLKALGMQKGYIFNAKHFPGVEFGPAVNSALGEKHFWDEVNRVHHTCFPDSPPLGTISTSVLALSAIHFDANSPSIQVGPLHFFSAVSNDVIIDHPRPDVTVPTSSHYQVPVGTHPTWLRGAGMEHLTRAQLEIDEWLDISPRGMAANTLMVASGIKTQHHAIADAYNLTLAPHSTNQHRTPYQIGVLGNDIGELSALARSIPCVFHCMSLSHLAQDDAWNHRITALYKQCDAFVIMPIDRADTDPLFDQLFAFFSSIVARQIHPRDIDKPLLIYNQNCCWQTALDLFDTLRNNAMIFDQTRLLIREVTTAAKLNRILEKSYQHRFTSTHEDSPSMPFPNETSGRFNVAIFCSAGARNDTLNRDAFHLGAFLGEHDFGLVFGAGDREMMGSACRGMVSKRTESLGWIGASSVDHILEVEADHPEHFKQPRSALNPSGPDQYYNAATIYDRMQYMIRTADAFAIIPGGAGTLQEMAALLLLKKQLHPSMHNKAIVVLNEMAISSQTVAFYQPLLDLIPQALRESLDIHVCTSMHEVEQKLLMIRDKQKRGPNQS